MATQSLKRLAAIILPLLATAIFAVKTHILSGGLYSGDMNYRYQTNAFLMGHLSLRNSLMQHLHDWAWNDGAYQVWGLGVPLLRLPFEAVASPFNWDFPDRLVLLFVHFFTGVAVFTGAWGVESLLLRSSLLVLLLLNPHLLELAGGNRLHVYEEAVAFNVLWAILGLALALKCAAGPAPVKRRGRVLWYLFAFVAGFSILIRPTGILWGASSFAIFTWQRRKVGAALWPVFAVFLIGPLLALLTNALRFGTPWSFGHEVTLMDRADLIYCSRWGEPFQYEPFFRAARELLGGLWSKSLFNRWRSPTHRFREFYFGSNFDWLLVLALLGCLAPAFWAFLRAPRTPRARKILCILALWALASFVVLFLFYLRFHAITSRYLMEFVPSVYAALAAGDVFLFSVLAAYRNRRYVAKLGAVSFAALLASCLVFMPGQGNAGRDRRFWSDAPHPHNVDASLAAAGVARWSFPQPLLPDTYQCGMRVPNLDVKYNGFGWSMSQECGVSEATMLFFDHLECLELSYSSSVAPDVRVAVGLVSWKQRSYQKSADPIPIVTELYCPAKPGLASHRLSSTDLVVIGWVNPDALGSGRQSHLKLHSVRNASWPL